MMVQTKEDKNILMMVLLQGKQKVSCTENLQTVSLMDNVKKTFMFALAWFTIAT